MFRDLVASFFVVLIVVGVPILSWQTAHNEEIRLLPRRTLYSSAAVSEWLLALMAVFAVFFSGLGFRAAGFRRLPLGEFFSWSALLAAVTVALLLVMLLLERRGWWPEESELVRLLVPETRREKLWAAMLVAPTAALCEEFIYRGVLFGELQNWSHSKILSWAVTSIAFGMTHVYQKPLGMARAGALGALLAYPVVRFGSLYPSVAAHFLIDAVALVWLGPKFLRQVRGG
jgi:membrane protease YdiL (CAAX protease family)